MSTLGTKQQVIEMIQRLPEDVSIDDIFEELHFRMKVDEGLRQLDEGKGIEHSEVVARLARWTGK